MEGNRTTSQRANEKNGALMVAFDSHRGTAIGVCLFALVLCGCPMFWRDPAHEGYRAYQSVGVPSLTFAEHVGGDPVPLAEHVGPLVQVWRNGRWQLREVDFAETISRWHVVDKSLLEWTTIPPESVERALEEDSQHVTADGLVRFLDAIRERGKPHERIPVAVALDAFISTQDCQCVLLATAKASGGYPVVIPVLYERGPNLYNLSAFLVCEGGIAAFVELDSAMAHSPPSGHIDEADGAPLLLALDRWVSPFDRLLFSIAQPRNDVTDYEAPADDQVPLALKVWCRHPVGVNK